MIKEEGLVESNNCSRPEGTWHKKKKEKELVSDIWHAVNITCSICQWFLLHFNDFNSLTADTLFSDFASKRLQSNVFSDAL